MIQLLSDQGRIAQSEDVVTCNKQCLINKLMLLAQENKSNYEELIADLREQNYGRLHRKLSKKSVKQLSLLLNKLGVDNEHVINTLVRENRFPLRVTDVVLKKQYDPQELFDVMTKLQNLPHEAIFQIFSHLDKAQIHTLAHDKPDLVRLLNCKYRNGCISFEDVKKCLD